MVRRGRSSSPKASAPVRTGTAPAAGAAPQRGSGLLGQMAATAGGVAIGSAMGHALGNMFSGGGQEVTPQQELPANSAGFEKMQQYSQPCEIEWRQFLDCTQNQGDCAEFSWAFFIIESDTPPPGDSAPQRAEPDATAGGVVTDSAMGPVIENSEGGGQEVAVQQGPPVNTADFEKQCDEVKSEEMKKEDEERKLEEAEESKVEKTEEEERDEEEVPRRRKDAEEEDEEHDEEEEEADDGYEEEDEDEEAGDEEEEAGDEEEDLDEDECKDSPAYIPKHGRFYMHDEAKDENGEEGPDVVVKRRGNDEGAQEGEREDEQAAVQRTTEPKTRADRVGRWSHDMFREREQAPKSSSELVRRYGNDIRRPEGEEVADGEQADGSRRENGPRRAPAPRQGRYHSPLPPPNHRAVGGQKYDGDGGGEGKKMGADRGRRENGPRRAPAPRQGRYHSPLPPPNHRAVGGQKYDGGGGGEGDNMGAAEDMGGFGRPLRTQGPPPGREGRHFAETADTVAHQPPPRQQQQRYDGRDKRFAPTAHSQQSQQQRGGGGSRGYPSSGDYGRDTMPSQRRSPVDNNRQQYSSGGGGNQRSYPHPRQPTEPVRRYGNEIRRPGGEEVADGEQADRGRRENGPRRAPAPRQGRYHSPLPPPNHRAVGGQKYDGGGGGEGDNMGAEDMGGFGRPLRTQGPPPGREGRHFAETADTVAHQPPPRQQQQRYDGRDKRFAPTAHSQQSQQQRGGGGSRGYPSSGDYGRDTMPSQRRSPVDNNRQQYSSGGGGNQRSYPHPRQPTEPVVFDPEQQARRGAPPPPRERRPLPIRPPTHY
uniref:Protein CASC3 n=1 Tax=Globodera rostochiensis TaxID=31243 RepID=A0A914HM87_GLORO